MSEIDYDKLLERGWINVNEANEISFNEIHLTDEEQQIMEEIGNPEGDAMIHHLVQREMGLAGWIELQGTTYVPTEKGKQFAQRMLATGKYNDRMIAQAIDPSIPKLTKEQEREQLYQEMLQRNHEELLQQIGQRTGQRFQV